MTIPIPPELQREIDASGGHPVPLVHSGTGKVYVVVDRDVFERLLVIQPEFDPSSAYAAIDEVFVAGWDTPEMAEYDKYEALDAEASYDIVVTSD